MLGRGRGRGRVRLDQGVPPQNVARPGEVEGKCQGRLHLKMPDVKDGEEENEGYIEAAQEPSLYVTPAIIIPIKLQRTERRLSISEDEESLQSAPDLDSSSIVTSSTSDPLTSSSEIRWSSDSMIDGTSRDDSSNVASKSDDENDPLSQFRAALEKERSFLLITAEFLSNENTTKDLVMEWVQLVTRRCLTSAVFCSTFASHFKILIQHKIYGKLIKKVTIDYLQEYYEERATSIDDKPGDFRGSVNLLGQIFLRYKIKGKPFRVVAQPLLECLLMMLNNPNEENVKIIAEQISLNGKALETIVPETMTQLIVSVQRHLLDTTSDTLRTWLLLITDLCFYGQPLSPEISEVFATSIGFHTIKAVAPPSEDKLYGEIPDEFTEKYAALFPE